MSADMVSINDSFSYITLFNPLTFVAYRYEQLELSDFLGVERCPRGHLVLHGVDACLRLLQAHLHLDLLVLPRSSRATAVVTVRSHRSLVPQLLPQLLDQILHQVDFTTESLVLIRLIAALTVANRAVSLIKCIL